VLPDFARKGISNFFSNIGDVIVALNNLLQGKFTNAISDVGRIAVNTTVGLLGLIDVASEMGLEKHDEDFGQTLGYWGLGSGPYLVLPLLGPSSVRDTFGLAGDWKTNPLTYVDPDRDRNALYGLSIISRRSELLEASDILATAALDPYEFVRDGYLQRRRNLVYDGNPPDENGVEIKEKPKPNSSVTPSFPAAANAGYGSTLVSGEAMPTPAELEARERAMSATAAEPPHRSAGEAAREAPKQTRVVRVWLPFSRN